MQDRTSLFPAWTLRLLAMRSANASNGSLAPPASFQDRLRELRKVKGLSQSQLGEQVGLHYTHIGRYERGVSRPGADTLQRLADTLGVSCDYLLEGSPEDAARADFKDRELLRQFQEVERLPDEDKAVIKRLLDAFLMKRQLESMLARGGS
jgi:transcriptional regulator with XRE-family HTH domain